MFARFKGQPLARAMELTRRAMAQDDNLAEPHALLGQIHLTNRKYEQAIAQGRRAVALEPNGADWRAYLASTLSYAGRAGEALTEMQRALRLNPNPPSWYPHVLARIYYLTGGYDEAIAILKELIERELAAQPSAHSAFYRSLPNHLLLIASYSAAGRGEEAREQVAKFQQFIPNFKPKVRIEYYDRYQDAADVQRLLDDLAKAGMK